MRINKCILYANNDFCRFIYLQMTSSSLMNIVHVKSRNHWCDLWLKYYTSLSTLSLNQKKLDVWNLLYFLILQGNPLRRGRYFEFSISTGPFMISFGFCFVSVFIFMSGIWSGGRDCSETGEMIRLDGTPYYPTDLPFARPFRLALCLILRKDNDNGHCAILHLMHSANSFFFRVFLCYAL